MLRETVMPIKNFEKLKYLKGKKKSFEKRINIYYENIFR